MEERMTFQDIFKSGFLENMGSISLLDSAIAMGMAFLLGMYIFFIYKQTYSGVMYSSGFGVSLIAMTLITTLLIMAVVSNVVLSLGMVGALSIVRFRTAIKEPTDLMFLFWSIAIGIVLAAGLIPLAVFGSIFIGLLLLLFFRGSKTDTPYILVVHCSGEQETQVRECIAAGARKMSLKSKSVTGDRTELNYEVRLKDEETGFLNTLNEMSGVSHVILVSYNGDYMG